MKKIHILLIEDNKLVRDGIATRLKKQPDMLVVAAAGNREKILMRIKKHNPDIALLDLGLGHQNSLQVAELFKKDFQEVKVVVMGLIPPESDIFEFVRLGVSGFILKDATVSEFIKTIRSVYQGNYILPAHLTDSLFSQIVEHAINRFKPSVIDESFRMTKREKQVIELIYDGSTNKEIAQKLNISTSTVKSHVHKILEKLAINTRFQIAKHVNLHNPDKTTTGTD
jgi:DNA-binding NarL/FixJ family response regulator